ncbi:MAG: hypothetical protein ACI36Z_10100 [Alloprevotella sp.]
MYILKDFIRFLKNGIDTFRSAYRGEYREESESIKQIRKEIFDMTSSRADDKRNMRMDRAAIERDFRTSFKVN